MGHRRRLPVPGSGRRALLCSTRSGAAGMMLDPRSGAAGMVLDPRSGAAGVALLPAFAAQGSEHARSGAAGVALLPAFAAQARGHPQSAAPGEQSRTAYRGRAAEPRTTQSGGSVPTAVQCTCSCAEPGICCTRCRLDPGALGAQRMWWLVAGLLHSQRRGRIERLPGVRPALGGHRIRREPEAPVRLTGWGLPAPRDPPGRMSAPRTHWRAQKRHRVGSYR